MLGDKLRISLDFMSYTSGGGGDIKTATVYLHDWNFTCNVNANLEVVF